MGYYTRVLSKYEDFPSFEELVQSVQSEHPNFSLTVEEGTEENWESILLSGDGEVEVAVLERNPVSEGSVGQDEIAEFLEETHDCKPESGVEWLHSFLTEVKTVYASSISLALKRKRVLLLFTLCAHSSGSAVSPSFRPTWKDSLTKMAITSFGNSLTR